MKVKKLVGSQGWIPWDLHSSPLQFEPKKAFSQWDLELEMCGGEWCPKLTCLWNSRNNSISWKKVQKKSRSNDTFGMVARTSPLSKTMRGNPIIITQNHNLCSIFVYCYKISEEAQGLIYRKSSSMCHCPKGIGQYFSRFIWISVKTRANVAGSIYQKGVLTLII